MLPGPGTDFIMNAHTIGSHSAGPERPFMHCSFIFEAHVAILVPRFHGTCRDCRGVQARFYDSAISVFAAAGFGSTARVLRGNLIPQYLS